ncbi:zinc finger, CCHC-type containing protein [Tanacetum coccineum]
MPLSEGEVGFSLMILRGYLHNGTQSIFSLCYLFRNPFSSTTIGDENPIRTLGDYSKPSHEGYRNTIELPVGNNVVPLRSDTIRLVQNGCSFHGLRSEDPNQHLKDFHRLMDSLDLNGKNRERTRLRLFQFSLRDQASNWLERLPVGSITTWEDLTTRFLAQFFPPGRTDLLRKVPHHGIDLWLQVNIFYDRIDHTLKQTVDYAAGGRLRKISAEKAWATIEELARYEDEGWNDPVALGEGSLDYENPDIEQLLGVMERKVDTLMKESISLMGRSESVFGMTSNTMYQLPLEPSRQEEFDDLVMILDQEEKVRQLKEYMCVIGNDFMQLYLEVVGKLREEIIIEQNRTKKIKKIIRYPDIEDLKPLNDHKFSETLTKEVPSHTPKIVSPKSLYVKHVRTIFPSPPLVRESTFGFKPGTNNNRNIKSRHDAENLSPQSSPQILPSFEVYTLPVTYPDEVEEIIGIPMEVEPLEETQLEDLGLNTCNHNIPFSSREIPCFDEPKPQPNPLPNCPSLDVSLGEERGPEPPIKPHSPDSFRMKEVDHLTNHTPPSPHVASFHPKDMYCYYHPCIGDPKKHYGFKPGLLRHSGSLGRILNSPVRIKGVKKVIFDEKKLGSS